MKTSKKMLPLALLSLTLLTLGLASCASTKQALALGAITGASVGAASGALIARSNQGEAALTMGLVAALVGGISGFFIHQGISQEGERVRRQTLLGLEQYGTGATMEGRSAPTVTPPMVESYDVKAKVEGKKLIGPHRVWMIREKAKWRLNGNENQQKNEVFHD